MKVADAEESVTDISVCIALLWSLFICMLLMIAVLSVGQVYTVVKSVDDKIRLRVSLILQLSHLASTTVFGMLSGKIIAILWSIIRICSADFNSTLLKLYWCVYLNFSFISEYAINFKPACSIPSESPPIPENTGIFLSIKTE